MNDLKTPYELFGDEGILKSGWKDFVQPLVDECKEKGYSITQIKEKYGTLRFYGFFPDEFYKKVDEAEKKSATVCYKCGQPGNTWYSGWYTTLCRPHAVEHYGEDEVKYLENKDQDDV